jgi:hypothetical protein
MFTSRSQPNTYTILIVLILLLEIEPICQQAVLYTTSMKLLQTQTCGKLSIDFITLLLESRNILTSDAVEFRLTVH